MFCTFLNFDQCQLAGHSAKPRGLPFEKAWYNDMIGLKSETSVGYRGNGEKPYSCLTEMPM